MITKMQPQANVAVPQSVTTQPQQIVGVPANAVILKMSDIQQISTVGECFCLFIGFITVDFLTLLWIVIHLRNFLPLL